MLVIWFFFSLWQRCINLTSLCQRAVDTCSVWLWNKIYLWTDDHYSDGLGPLTTLWYRHDAIVQLKVFFLYLIDIGKKKKLLLGSVLSAYLAVLGLNLMCYIRQWNCSAPWALLYRQERNAKKLAFLFLFLLNSYFGLIPLISLSVVLGISYFRTLVHVSESIVSQSVYKLQTYKTFWITTITFLATNHDKSPCDGIGTVKWLDAKVRLQVSTKDLISSPAVPVSRYSHKMDIIALCSKESCEGKSPEQDIHFSLSKMICCQWWTPYTFIYVGSVFPRTIHCCCIFKCILKFKMWWGTASSSGFFYGPDWQF